VVDGVRQYSESLAITSVMLSPVIRKLIASFLAHHTLLDPFFTTAVLLPVFTRPINGLSWIRNFL
jgi:hypothetical protein